MRRLITRRPAASFVVLAFACSYTVGLATLWIASAWIRPLSELAAQYVGRVGVVFGPAVAALTVTSVTDGRTGMIRLLSRLKIRRGDVAWIGLLPAVSLGVAAVASIATGTPRAAVVSAVRDGWDLLLAHYVLGLLVVGIGEELGWRGWLLPTLLTRHRRFNATLLVATVWCVWHLPKLLSGGDVAVALAVLSYALSFLFTALWSHTGVSVLLVALAHASANAPIVFFGATLGYERALSAWLGAGVVYAAAAVVVIAARWSWWRGMSAVNQPPQPVLSNRG